MSDKVAKVAKPQLRGLLASQGKRNLITALILGVLGGTAHYFLVGQPRKQRYAEFYKHYDIEKEFEKMRRKGLFDSC